MDIILSFSGIEDLDNILNEIKSRTLKSYNMIIQRIFEQPHSANANTS